LKLNGRLGACSPNVLAQTYDILESLARHQVRATFFILGLVAEAHPKLIREIADAGHEIGSHGWSHSLIYRQERATFERETRRSKDVLEDALGRKIDGYRAAEFSITAESRWALEVLAGCGFVYDSSIFPIAGGRYGIPGSPLVPHRVDTAAGPLIEVPLTAVEMRGRRWPIGGGGYFRLLPYSVTRAAIESVNAAGRAANVYFHPYEFSRRLLLPRLYAPSSYFTGARYVLFHNMNRGVNRRRFERMLSDFQFEPIKDLITRGQ
jgi:polysaccharide deacetylase family protein (PEP-CTERM system associated)